MKFLAILFLLFLLAVAAVGAILYLPYGPSTETFVEIVPGTTTAAIADQLQQDKIIRSRLVFDLLHLVHRRTLRAGEYRFDHPASMIEVYRRIAHGDIYTLTLSIPEGYNIFDIAQAIEKVGLGSHETFLDAERKHTELIAEWSPQADSLEGYLFPATYHFSRHATPEQILTAMVHRFRQAANQLNLHSDIANTVIMASLVEKEVGVDSERPLVAGVFKNRLAKDMPLGTDPAVIYAALLENRYRGTIYQSDLQSLSPYNTYKHTGLPPGPICNPGLAAFRAAISPATTDMLYFVSDGAGHTRFAATIEEHQRNVQAYRQVEHAQGLR